MKWKYPDNSVMFLKMELATIIVVSLLIFFLSVLAQEGFVFAFLFALLFALIYAVIAYIMKSIWQEEHHFELTSTHLHTTVKNRFSTKKTKVPLKKIHHHRIDGFFLDGYALSNIGKHLLFFNNKKEHKQFVKHLKKHGKKK